MSDAILVAEDEPSSAEYLRVLLEGRGHTVRLAANGLEALLALESRAFDLVITDLRMPSMDGFELLSHLAQRWPDLPASKRQELATAIVDHLLLFLVGLAIHSVATLALFGHAVANGRALWAAGNLLLFFIPPLYALVVLETDALKKALILVAWATGPAAALALHWSIAGIVA